MRGNYQKKSWIVYVSTFPPRECGIATFTEDLVKNFDDLYAPREEAMVIALNNNLKNYKYSNKVIFQISENKAEDYLAAAEKLNNLPYVEIVSVQHEFGIYGDNYGENLLLFLKNVKKPIVITFHTMLPCPTQKAKDNMSEIIKLADRLVTMTDISKVLLEEVYGASAKKIRVIYHGTHPIEYNNGQQVKKELKLENKKVISTFGLLGRDKGIEYGIEAMSEIVKYFPDVVYLIIGATHPVILKNEGEVYRNELIKKVEKLGLKNNVYFYNSYFTTNILLKFLQATDIYLSLSQNPDQAVSGTLTYALGTGRPVISTAFMQAKEMVTPDVGSLVGFHQSHEISKEVISMFSDPVRILSMGKTAYFRTRKMTWKNVVLAYMKEFIELSPELSKTEKNIPRIKLKHLNKLTDSFGIFQFADLDKPDAHWGYTVDDNARALVAVIWYYQISNSKIAKRLANIYLNFIERASKSGGGFNNYFGPNKHEQIDLNKDVNLEDAFARAIWSLSVAYASNMTESFKSRAKKILEYQRKYFRDVSSPRAAAFLIKGLSIWYELEKNQKSEESDDIKILVTKYADFLLGLFDRNSSKKWEWFEEYLTYSNAVLSEAMLIAYKTTGNYLYFKAGKASLEFLIQQSFHGKICAPVGQAGWYKKEEIKHIYDQQPEEVSALILASKTMFDLCGDHLYQLKAKQAFNWFLGDNILQQIMYSHLSGGCYDGLRKDEVNLNQGAESTISYLLSRLAMEE